MIPKILFIDNDKNILDSFRATMHGLRKEWKSYFASTGQEALDKLGKAEFDIVISDTKMPDMDGSELLRKVAEIQPDTIRITLSGHSDMQSLLKSAKHTHQFLSKPCNTEVLIGTIRKMMELRPVLTDHKVREIITGLDTLPVLPDLYIEITNELNKPEPNLQKLGELVKKDPGISTTLLKVVNSSFFGFYNSVSSPARATILLGTDVLKGLILGVHFIQKLDKDTLGPYSIEKLWEHCLQTGYLAKEICAFMDKDEQTVTNCFVGGLLHDIGKFVFITEMNKKYQKVLEHVREFGGPVIDVEKKILGVSHAEVGAYLLGLWGFNEEIVEMVYYHHSLDNCGEIFTPTHAIHAADTLQHELIPHSKGYIFSELNTDKMALANLLDHVNDWRAVCNNLLETNKDEE
ncbi:response regulator [Maridesulfovibrio salexigens]|uniref:Response regulator receiver modulated metal dependent phosphohydrolase n=1 Tax=Maridesulfovibrio salexigens (strain ATCC 14822 / DSM 2638 / NCIMB 8403 / VKM B-1763) TaxID=526222 RepID=C6BZY8_MARSD|nr:response regulator [Maridesulfovibrio salexigens]ACS80859.1 response regulator receiver modulated metal dependent phosphohydrolase [Maridesulfovibrio salexigens DSM 2638]